MGLFDFFKRSGKTEELTPEQLHAALARAALSGNARELGKLCRAHRAAVVEHFPSWQKVPEELRNNTEAVQQRIHTLVCVAQFFAEALGDASLFERLTGPPGSNPLGRWQEKLEE